MPEFSERHLSLRRTLSAPASDAIRFQELCHGGSNLHDVGLYRKMPRVKELDSCFWQIFSKCLCARRQKEGIILAPDRQQRRLRFAEIFLKLRIELHVRGVVQKQIELNFYISRALEQSRIQGVGLRRNAVWIRDSVRVLPAGPFQGQN